MPELKQITIESGSYLEDLYNSIENPNILKRGVKLSKDIFVLGAIKKRNLTDKEHSAVCQCLGSVPISDMFRYFQRLENHKNLIYGRSYSRMVKRDNSTICYKVGDNLEGFGKVSYY